MAQRSRFSVDTDACASYSGTLKMNANGIRVQGFPVLFLLKRRSRTGACACPKRPGQSEILVEPGTPGKQRWLERWDAARIGRHGREERGTYREGVA
jgi:hypothetical protein